MRQSIAFIAVACLLGGVGPLWSETPTHALTVLGQALPEPLPAGVEITVGLELRNDGSETWVRERGFAVAYHWLSAEGEVVQWDGLRTALSEPVPAGGTVRLHARLATPVQPGEYRLQWDVVQEQVCWASERDPSPEPPVDLTVRISHAMTVLDCKGPSWMFSGGRARWRLAVRNDGAVTWLADGSFNLSYHWADGEGKVVLRDGERTAVAVEVAPGETTTFEALLVAPAASGRHTLQWDMVHEGVCWFAEEDPSPHPSLPIRLVSPLGLAAGVLTLLTLLTLLAAAAAMWAVRQQASGALVAVLAVVDLAWLALSIAAKQWLVLTVAGHRPSAGGTWGIAGGMAVLVLLVLLVPRRVRPWCVWLVAALSTVILVVDAVYLRFFGDLVSWAALHSAGQLGEVRASVASLLTGGDVWLAVDLLAALPLVLVVARLQARAGANGVRLVGAAAGLVAVVGLGAAWVHGSSRGVLSQVFRNVFVARDLGVLNFHLLDAGRAVRGSLVRAEIAEEELDRIEHWFRQRAASRAGVGPHFGVAAGCNLLMIQVESLQLFVLGFEIGGAEVTPNLNRWVEHSLLFTAVADQTGHGRSSDCELATQVSLLPHPEGPAAFLYAGNEYTGLAGILAGHGYTTVSAVPFEATFWNRRQTHAAYGYAGSLFAGDFAPGETIGWGLSDRDFLAQMAHRLAAMPRPFCALLITLSLHHPFERFPERHKVLDVGRHEATPFGNYLHTMHYFDSAFAAMVAELERTGVLDDTVIVLWGDHDAGLGWDQKMAAALGTRWHEPDWYLTERVPLILRLPGVSEVRGASGVPAGQADVAPTLLAVLGIDPAPYAFVGRNLLGAPGSSPVVGAYGSVVDADHLFVPGGSSLTDGRCYELSTLGRVAPEACRDELGAAARMGEVSRAVLEHDLQERLHHRLAGGSP